MNLQPEAADQAYITRRIIDCCLREDIRGVVSQGRICPLPEALHQLLAHQSSGIWLRITDLAADELWAASGQGVSVAGLECYRRCLDPGIATAPA